ncbi:MAG TPA: AMP-binding protein [Micromonosporaceae bacterium]
MTAPHWRVHLRPGSTDVDLAAGGSLPGAFTAAWATDPGRVVLSTLDGVRLNADELAARTSSAAGRYAAAGLSPGDRVLLSAGTSVDLVVAYLGALRRGLTVVPANPGSPDAELARLASGSRPALAVLDSPGRLGDARVPVTTPDLASLPRSGGPVDLDRARPEDVALIIYTSGTTGRPKGVPLSHANLLASAHAVRLAWRWQPDDRLALCLPLFHVHGLGVGLHGTLVTGASATLMPKFEPAAVAAAIADDGATMFFGVPTMYHRLAGSAHLSSLAGLRLAVSGSAPLPVGLHAALREGSGQVVLERYGMTETVMLVSNPYDGERRPGTVGFPLPGVEVRLAPRSGGVSEIEVRGPNVISGYLDDPAATAASFTVDGWLRTGDLGELDSDGYLRISGRVKELIISGGYNVYPREVEEVLREHPEVADAAVVGAPSAEWGETVVAFIVAADPADADALAGSLVDWCVGRLTAYKRPREWRFVPAIPRNALGKIERHRLTP